jgi:hypothetical protein
MFNSVFGNIKSYPKETPSANYSILCLVYTLADEFVYLINLIGFS